MTASEYRALMRRLDAIHDEMFDQMGLCEVSDPRAGLVYRLADIMEPLRDFVPVEAPPAPRKGED